MLVMYCPSCHKKVQSSFAKCPYCAMSFVKQSAIEPKSSLGALTFKKIKKIILILLSILGVLFVLFIVWAIKSAPSMTTNSTSTSEQYTSPNQTKDTEMTTIEEPKVHAMVEEKPDFMNAEDRFDIPPQYRDALEPIDEDAILDKDVSQDDFLLGLSAIRAQGYNCKSISSVALMYGGGVRYRCNNFSNQYEVIKEDGVFQVTDKS